MELDEFDRSLLAGEAGPAAQLAMELVVAVGEAQGAPGLVDIVSAHVDGCLYHGPAGLDFAELLVEQGGSVRVPTTLNVSAIDLLHPDLYRGEEETADNQRRLMERYVDLGCLPTWTCAPYQLEERPSLGEQVAWGESNAIVFANSVLGARTNRYGDFMDICAALTGRVPLTGLHTQIGRKARIVIELDLPEDVLDGDLAYTCVGHVVGRLSGNRVPVIVGLDERADEDRLKALGATAASTGAVGMFHAVGVTPEAPDLETATGGTPPSESIKIGLDDLEAARDSLTTSEGELGAVCLGTPHMSLSEMRALARTLAGASAVVPIYVNTSRDTLSTAAAEGIDQLLRESGVTIVTDTCTYITPIIGDIDGVVMTNSGKWAYYAPSNLGVEVVLASLEDCVEGATTGTVVTGRSWS